ncbi:glycosyltransferase family 9 protein [Bordetella genomosp. 9]|uniref:Heptosyltransferase n=1 Tax=Bordetella genomosp. 9 TaxID=1416803 RepID=A0A1W6YYI7_9BORD|nr:glycosyltransferase family 9 protein [Bordetella genomosp. 9]ARP86116.1 heptosyltransferase [Bordetella genomosp. 9]
MPPITRLYVRLPNWVGDVCMSLPALRLLRAAGVPVVLCARPWARDLLAGVAGQDDFIAMRGGFLHDRGAVRAHVRTAGRGGVALALPDSLSSAAVFRLAGLPVAGYRDDGRSPLLRWPVNKPAGPLHAVQSWYYLAREALGRWALPTGNAHPGPELGLTLTPAHRADADAALIKSGLRDRPFVLIAPTATGLHRGRNKVWPGFADLTRALKAAGLPVVMCPPPAEAQAARANAPDALLLPPMGLGAFAALATRAALVVCNDSGVSHVAAAVGARQITLFGVTQRARTGPWSAGACCLGDEDAWPSVQEVAQTAENLLNLPAPGGASRELTGAAPA